MLPASRGPPPYKWNPENDKRAWPDEARSLKFMRRVSCAACGDSTPESSLPLITSKLQVFAVYVSAHTVWAFFVPVLALPAEAAPGKDRLCAQEPAVAAEEIRHRHARLVML